MRKYGRPGIELLEKAERGEIILGLKDLLYLLF